MKLELEKRNLPPPRWCSHFLATVVRPETPLTIRESLAGISQANQTAQAPTLCERVLRLVVEYERDTEGNLTAREHLTNLWVKGGFSAQDGTLVCTCPSARPFVCGFIALSTYSAICCPV